MRLCQHHCCRPGRPQWGGWGGKRSEEEDVQGEKGKIATDSQRACSAIMQ